MHFNYSPTAEETERSGPFPVDVLLTLHEFLGRDVGSAAFHETCDERARKRRRDGPIVVAREKPSQGAR